MKFYAKGVSVGMGTQAEKDTNKANVPDLCSICGRFFFNFKDWNGHKCR